MRQQQRLSRRNIRIIEHASGLAQLEPAGQQLIAGQRQVTPGLIDLGLGVEYINIDTHTDFVAKLVGFQGAFAGGQRGLQCVDLGLGRLHAQKGGAHVLLGAALGVGQLSAGFFFQGNGFLHPVLYGEARKQGHVHHYADIGGVGAVVERHLRRHRAIGVAVDHIGRLQVHGGLVAGLGFLGFQLGNIQRHLGLANLRLLGESLIDPGLHVRRHQRCQLDGLGQRQRLNAHAADQLVQRHLLDLQVVLRSHFLGRGQIKTGLGFTRISNRGGAHFKVALGKLELLGNGFFLRGGHGQAVLRGQHIEIGLRDTNQQVLLRRSELGLSDIQTALALFVGNLVGRAVQGLLGADLQVLLAAVHAARQGGIGVGAVELHMRAIGPGLQAHAGQQPGSGLVGPALRSPGIGLLGLPLGVKAARLLDQLAQRLGLGGTGGEQGKTGG